MKFSCNLDKSLLYSQGMRIRSKKIFLQEIIISVIVITENDSDIIADILKDINQILSKSYENYEILVVDNYSNDNTINLIRAMQANNPHARILRLSKYYNREIALTAGLDNCIGDYAILLNIYTDPPSIIPQVVDQLLEANDILIGRYKENLIKRDFLSKLLMSLLSKLSSHEFRYDSSYLFGLNRRAINSITQIRRKSRNFSYIHSLIGFRKVFMEYKPMKNYLTKLKHENFIELLIRITDIIISNSSKPMRILIALGMLISLAFLFYVFIVIIFAVFLNIRLAPEGWISTSAILGSMFFILFSLLSLISEYLIRVLNESRNEPLYFISEEMDKSVISIKNNKLNII